MQNSDICALVPLKIKTQKKEKNIWSFHRLSSIYCYFIFTPFTLTAGTLPSSHLKLKHGKHFLQPIATCAKSANKDSQHICVSRVPLL